MLYNWALYVKKLHQLDIYIYIYIYIYICILYVFYIIIYIIYTYIYMYIYILHIIYYYFYDSFRLYTSYRYNVEHYWTLPCFAAKMTGAATGGLLQKKLFIKKLHQFQRKAHVLEPHSNSLILKLQVGGPAALLITDTNTSAFLRNV